MRSQTSERAMPATSPRIQVTVDDELADAIRRIGLATGRSQSGVIGWVLAAQREALLQLAGVLDLARQVEGQVGSALQVELTRMEADTLAAAAQAREQLDMARVLLEEERDRRDALAEGRPDPLRHEPSRPILRLASASHAAGGKP